MIYLYRCPVLSGLIEMSAERRRFIPGAVNHCCQKTINGVVLFYNVSDYLVIYTQFCVSARCHKVHVLSLALMPDHLHHCIVAYELADMSAFVKDYTSHFATAHNALCAWDQSLFVKPYESAPKMGDKAARSALVYVGNNGPERKLSIKAEEYRWSFLGYYRNPHPFSEPLKLSHASKAMRRAVSLVKDRCKRNKPLRYQTLQWLFKPLSNKERLQLTDYIINIYNVIDYERAIAFFGSYETMIEAMHITKGSEYEIQEEFVGWDDKVYGQMSKVIMEQNLYEDIHDLLSTPEDQRRELVSVLKSKTGATEKQVMKYLRLPLK